MNEIRLNVWDKFYKGINETFDVFGNPIRKNDFEVDHLYPKSLNGSDNIDNLIPLSPLSNKIKSYHIKGNINSRRFEITKMIVKGGKIIGCLYINGVNINDLYNKDLN